MKTTWTLKDCINLLFFIDIDSSRNITEEMLHKRDRDIYLHAAEPQKEPPPSKYACLRIWLTERTRTARKEDNLFLPGEKVEAAYRHLRLLLFIAGLLFGSTLAASYFVYTGTTPLNIFEFFTLFIVPQLLLLLVFPLRRIFQSAAPPPGILSLLKVALERIFLLSHKVSLLDRQDKIDCRDLLFRKQLPLHIWPLLLVCQIFSIGFNCGIIVYTLLKITTSDLAFGWQTTLNVGPEALYNLASAAATPWSWLVPAEIAFPSLEQIEGSRIILKEGILDLTTNALTAWWPFLLFCLCVYGLAPRLILLLISHIMTRRRLNTCLSSGDTAALVKRMTTPVVTTQAAPQMDAPAENKHHQSQRSPAHALSAYKAATVLIADEIFNACSEKELKKQLTDNHVPIKTRIKIFHDFGADLALLRQFEQSGIGMDEIVLIVLEAWMVPITEQLNFIRQLDQAIAPQGTLGILLIGKPDGDGSFKPAEDADIAMWQHKLGEYTNNPIQLN